MSRTCFARLLTVNELVSNTGIPTDICARALLRLRHYRELSSGEVLVRLDEALAAGLQALAREIPVQPARGRGSR